MHYRPLTLLAAVLFVASAATAARPQSSSSGQTAPAPDQTSAANSSSSTATPPAQKKVWTNEDVPDLRGQSVISTVGDPNANRTGRPATTAKNNGASKPYQAQIARLQAQIPSLDAQIAELQAAIDGKPTGDAKASQRPRSVKGDDWSVEMQDLRKKKDAILEQIAALKDQARHQGVPPNTLP
jgi:hypothetical protein